MNFFKNKSLIIGSGEVGQALYEVLSPHHKTILQDKIAGEHMDIKYLHICYPYSNRFIDFTKGYIAKYSPKYTVIHSTVPIGTSDACGAFHSPIRGVHPNLADGIRIFVKYLSPFNVELAKYFQDAGIRIRQIENTKDTEALKIWDTTQYGFLIILEKEIYNYCKNNGLDFNIVYTEANNTYNEGYSALGKKNYIRPVLKHMDGKIGGHCIINNCNFIENKITKIIKLYNENITN